MKTGLRGRLGAGAAVAVLLSGAAWALPVQPMAQLAKGASAGDGQVWLVVAEAGAPDDKMWHGDDKGEPAADDVTDMTGDAEAPDDGMVWAGGDPDFCEACGGEIVDDGTEPGVDETGTDPGDPGDFEVIEAEPVDDDGMVWAGGDPDFCETCDGVIVDDGELMMTVTGIPGEPRGASQFSGRAPGGERPDRGCGMAGVAYRCGDR